MRAAARSAVILAALAGIAAEIWAVTAGWSWISAALDLIAGWSLLAVAGWGTHLTIGCRAFFGLAGTCWFAATPEVVGGSAGHAAALLGGAWLAPFATATLGSPGAWPSRWEQRAAAVVSCVRAIPVLAPLGWLTVVTGGLLAEGGLRDVRRYAVRVPRMAAILIGVLLGISGLLQAIGGRGAALEPLLALSVAASGVAVLAFRPARAATDAGLTGLVVELGRTSDASSLERRLAFAIGDPRLRLLYQLAPGLPFVTTAGSRAGATPSDRVVTVLGQSGPVVAALEHDSAALDDPQLLQAVLAVGRLAVRRLQVAAEAAQQSIELADSRRRLIQAEAAALEQFARDVADGPGRSLAQCLDALDVALDATPESLREDVAAALAAGQAARQELSRIAAGQGNWALAGDTLADALLDLASSAGAKADLSIECEVDGAVATAAWYAASEGLANALKHAGPARIWLTVTTDAGSLWVQVTDDGVGGADPQGTGLKGLAERLARHGARLQVLGGEGGGTRLVAELPLDIRQHVMVRGPSVTT
jgi:signal transduction histidine kinase